MLLVANDVTLGTEWLDHPLKDIWADHRECHIGGDFLLICQVKANWGKSSAAKQLLRMAALRRCMYSVQKLESDMLQK